MSIQLKNLNILMPAQCEETTAPCMSPNMDPVDLFYFIETKGTEEEQVQHSYSLDQEWSRKTKLKIATL